MSVSIEILLLANFQTLCDFLIVRSIDLQAANGCHVTISVVITWRQFHENRWNVVAALVTDCCFHVECCYY